MPESPSPERDAPPRPLIPVERVGLLDRVQALRSDARVGAAIAAAVVVAAAVVWMRTSSHDASPALNGAASTVSPSNERAGATTTTNANRLLLHVVGAVRSAGVVELEAGARIRDAVAAAGGAADDADLERLNLAAPVSDGERIAVPRIGEPDPVPVAGPAGGGGGAVGSEPGTNAGPLNVNTATAAELEVLPGIGPTLAAAIVRERERLGGFETVDDLKQVRGIGDGRFADIRELVTV